MEIDIYKEPLDILAKINLCNSLDAEHESPNKLAFSKTGRQELSTLCGLIKRNKPKKILEVGVAAGGTSSVIMNAVNKLQYQADLYCVDFASTCFWDATKEVGFILDMAAKYMDDYCTLHIAKGKTLIQEIEKIGKDIDLVLLDTSHTMPGEILDFLVVFPYLSENAVVIVDDILSPIIHQLPPYCNSNSWIQIAPRLLWASISGESIDVNNKDWKKYQYGIKQVDVSDILQIKRLIDLLYLPWKTRFDDQTIESVVCHMKNNYPEELVDEFVKAWKLNKMLIGQV